MMNSKMCTGGDWVVGRRQLALLAILASLVVPAATAQAGLIDNFQTYTTGTVAGGATGTPGTWTALGNADGAQIQDESGNKLLTVGATAVGANVNVYRSIPAIAASNTATTVFVRVRANVTTGLNASFGLADIVPADGNAVSQFEAQFRLIAPGTPATPAIEGRNTGAFVPLITPISVGQWYNVWMVVNNSTDKWDAYINTGTANATAGDLKFSGLGFRNGAASNPLTHFVVFGGAGGVAGESVDDIYISEGLDLTNPLAVPEPASCALALTGLCFLVMGIRGRGRVSTGQLDQIN